MEPRRGTSGFYSFPFPGSQKGLRKELTRRTRSFTSLRMPRLPHKLCHPEPRRGTSGFYSLPFPGSQKGLGKELAVGMSPVEGPSLFPNKKLPSFPAPCIQFCVKGVYLDAPTTYWAKFTSNTPFSWLPCISYAL